MPLSELYIKSLILLHIKGLDNYNHLSFGIPISLNRIDVLIDITHLRVADC